MAEIPEPIKAILHEEGITAACWKRLKDAWPEPMEAVISAAWSDLLAARRDVVKLQQKIKVVEICNVPKDCVTLKDAEKAMIAAAIKDSHCTNDVLAAAARLGMGKTTLYRKLKQYGLHTTSESFMLKKKIEQLQAEIARLEKLLPEEMGGK